MKSPFSRLPVQSLLGGAVLAAVLILFTILIPKRQPLGHSPFATGMTPPTAIATVPITGLLTWQKLPLAPWQQLTNDAHATFDVAQSDGDIAYACAQSAGDLVAHIWATHDRGMNWQPLTAIPSVQQGSCSVSVDQLNPQHLIISTAVIKIDPIPTPVAAFLSTDGGQHWQKIDAPANIESLVSTPTATFAEIGNDPPDYAPYLAVSRDGLKTWQKVTIAHQSPTRFYFSRAGGLLAIMASDPDHLWFSKDLAQTWQQQGLPRQMEAINITAIHYGAQGWQICGNGNNPSIACSWDNGKTWRPIPDPIPISFPTATTNVTTPYMFQAWWITPDGSVLIKAQKVVMKSYTPTYLYRYTPATQYWQLLSTLPENPVSYTPTPGNGIFWSITPGGANSQDRSPQQNYVAMMP